MLKSELVSDATASDDTNQFVLESLGLEHDGPVQYMLMRSEYADQIVVCALVGGELHVGVLGRILDGRQIMPRLRARHEAKCEQEGRGAGHAANPEDAPRAMYWTVGGAVHLSCRAACHDLARPFSSPSIRCP